MKILYYNWVDYLDPEKRGGGVTVYQANVMSSLKQNCEVQEVFLSAGISYDLFGGKPRWEATQTGPSDTRRYDLINSGVLAPSHHSFGDPSQVDHEATTEAFIDFVNATGPYDVIHFNNLEGIPASVLKIKEIWPQTRIILSLHNYYFACPQVNLWHQERETCEDFNAGMNCADCLHGQHNPKHLRIANGLSYRLKKAGLHPDSWTFKFCFTWTMRLARRAVRVLRTVRGLGKSTSLKLEPPHETAQGFVERRSRFIALINAHCDRVLCVSDAVSDLAKHYGIAPHLVHTNYIGTREAQEFQRTKPHSGPVATDGGLTLAYLGYMRRDKGFYFMLSALENLPKETAQRIHLTVAARRGDAETMQRLQALQTHLAEVTHMDGYHHDDLDTLLEKVDVGVIPVLWHDNLPQVAIEMHARHIPLLTSHMGGAKELANCPDMVFEAGNEAQFQDRLTALLEGRIDMDAYWRSAMAPKDMASHMKELFAHYQKDAS
ncbi:glycosyltransferase family 4 protein [Shimia sp. R11_0]|uniref:glycosyltransferase n=1 Tax=Shimia sp. R11_0 TaxID=2821096 RepID=UPI001ADBDC16|nr:glycosyltransferase [Shimia sp. R11_0]MBO9476113.1 glycosyltransferase family 4 protein [Shimia sp. R11_0]